MIYNMVGQKTASFIVLLNVFSLNMVRADDFYDTLKSKKKYDSKTVNEVRKDTVEKSRAEKVNAQTQANPNFAPLSKTPPKALTWEELEKKRDAETNAPDDVDDKIIGGKAKEDGKPAVAEDGPSEPKTPKRAARGDTSEPATGGSVKVTTEDPDEVSFEKEEAPPAHKPTAPLKHK